MLKRWIIIIAKKVIAAVSVVHEQTYSLETSGTIPIYWSESRLQTKKTPLAHGKKERRYLPGVYRSGR